MSHKVSSLKLTSLVILGNTLEYYDFLLFAHLGLIMIGLSLSGIAPSLSDYFVNLTGWQFIPAYLLSGVAGLTALTLWRSKTYFDPPFLKEQLALFRIISN